MTRALSLERQGLALAAVDTDLEALAAKLHELVDDEIRGRLGRRAGETMSLMTGASETAVKVASIGEGFDHRKRTASRLARAQVERGKELVRHILGEERTEDLKRMLGRVPKPIYKRSRVTLADATGGGDADNLELALVRSVSTDELRSGQPIEHLLAESSDSYEIKRREIIDRHYEVVSNQ